VTNQPSSLDLQHTSSSSSSKFPPLSKHNHARYDAVTHPPRLNDADRPRVAMSDEYMWPGARAERSSLATHLGHHHRTRWRR
jgi:hypothetical protein